MNAGTNVSAGSCVDAGHCGWMPTCRNWCILVYLLEILNRGDRCRPFRSCLTVSMRLVWRRICVSAGWHNVKCVGSRVSRSADLMLHSEWLYVCCCATRQEERNI